jgi:hypothetical protein
MNDEEYRQDYDEEEFTLFAGCMNAVGIMVFIIAAVMLCCIMCGCSPKIIEHVTIKTDTCYIAKTQRDSIWLHDSIFVSEKQHGDTILLTTTKWLTKYIEKQVYDTTLVATHDTIQVVQTKEVPRRLSSFQNFQIWLARIVMGIAAAALGLFGFKFFKKFVV